jgi:predicted metal-binding membrane protein
VDTTVTTSVASRQRGSTLALLAAVIVAAWGLACWAEWSGVAGKLHHHALYRDARPIWVSALLFLGAWQVMTAAMMLPSSMPMLYMIIHASRQGARPRRVQAAFLAGYAAVWTVFAVAAFVLDLAVQALAGSWPWLAERPWLIGSVTLAIAGGFQFSALKERCLTACRSPLGFFVHHYRRGERGAWRLGLRHGAFCLGCCWALMLVMFGVGIHSLMLMAGLAGVMVIEKAVPGGRRLSPLIGGTLLVLAALWLVHPTWLAVAAGMP